MGIKPSTVALGMSAALFIASYNFNVPYKKAPLTLEETGKLSRIENYINDYSGKNIKSLLDTVKDNIHYMNDRGIAELSKLEETIDLLNKENAVLQNQYISKSVLKNLTKDIEDTNNKIGKNGGYIPLTILTGTFGVLAGIYGLYLLRKKDKDEWHLI